MNGGTASASASASASTSEVICNQKEGNDCSYEDGISNSSSYDDIYTKNWSKNIAFHSNQVLFPTSVDQVQRIVRTVNREATNTRGGTDGVSERSCKKSCIKAYGTRHSFNDIADVDILNDAHKGNAVHVCLERMTDIVINRGDCTAKPESERHPQNEANCCEYRSDDEPACGATVTFQGGVTFTRLMQAVKQAGFALENLPSLPHISVVGAILTATHGSGHKHPIIAANVTAFDIVHPDGKLTSYHRPKKQCANKKAMEDFNRYLISFGSLGVIVSATMTLRSDFQVSKGIYSNLPFNAFYDSYVDIMHGADFLSLFTDWSDEAFTSVWVGQKYEPKAAAVNLNESGTEACHESRHRPDIPSQWFGANHIMSLPSVKRYHPIAGQDPEACIEVGYGPWHDKITHFLPDKQPSSAGNEIQAEYFVPYKDFCHALRLLFDHRDEFRHIVQITEIRMMCQDNIPMSQAKNGPMVGIHFTLNKVPLDELSSVLMKVESVLERFNFKVHFGKWFVLQGQRQFGDMYKEDARQLRKLIEFHDPKHIFSNAYVDRYIPHRV